MYATATSGRVRAARRLTKRALRQRERAFLAEGPQAVSEALASGIRVSGLFVTGPAQARHATLVEKAADAGTDVQVVSGEVMSELAQTVTPQGLLAVCDFVDVPLETMVAGRPRLVALLANVRDPGNAGTVLRAADADAAAAAGASFAVTPAVGEGVTRAIERGMPVLAGALTPTELWQAHLLGATAVKIFPAAQYGPGYVRALRDPFPDVPLVPVGGVDAEHPGEYLRAGAVAVGIGSPLTGDAPHGGGLAALRERARRFREAVAPWTA